MKQRPIIALFIIRFTQWFVILSFIAMIPVPIVKWGVLSAEHIIGLSLNNWEIFLPKITVSAAFLAFISVGFRMVEERLDDIADFDLL